MTDTGQSPSAGPSVCPFVALAEDRDRRADSPDEGNRCYAERAPRQRDLLYQADYCYSRQFASCSVFLGWAARNAASPAAGESAPQGWSGGSVAVDDEHPAQAEPDVPVAPTPDGGLFGAVDPQDWVSASAWAEVPWDERAEMEADELEHVVDEPDEDAEDEADEARAEEDTQAPKVPAAVPIRRRKRRQPVIRSRGSGEWYYADPPGHEPLVTRRYGVTPPLLLGVLGLLVAAIVVFLVAALFLGGGDSGGTAALPSALPDASSRPAATRAPRTTADPSADPSPSSEPNPRFYRVKSGDSLTGIATRFGVKVQHLQCLNNIRNKNIIALGARYEIPPEGFSCPPGWRNATPEP